MKFSNIRGGKVRQCHRVKDMKRTAKYLKRTSIALMLGALGCVIAFQVIGSEVAEDGTLVEPFFLIPLAWLLLITGGMLAIATFIIGRFKSGSAT